MPKKKAGGGKGKGPRADKAPPTPNSANPQQHNSALPSPERTPTALTKPRSLPGSPSTPVVGLPTVAATHEDQQETTKEAPVTQTEPGVTEVQLPTPSEPDVPLPIVVGGDGAPAPQPELAANTDGHKTESQSADSVSAHLDNLPESGQAEADGLLEPIQVTPEPEKEAENAVDADVGDRPIADSVKAVEEPLQTLSQPTEESEKPLPPPPEDEVHENGQNADEKPQDLLLQASEAIVGEGQDHTVGLADLGTQQDQGALLDWDDWGEESTVEQLHEAPIPIDVDGSAEVPVSEVLGLPEAEPDPGSTEISVEVATNSHPEPEPVEDLIDVQPSAEVVESEQTGGLLEQPFGGGGTNAAFENRNILTVEDAGIGQVTANDDIIDFGVLDSTQWEGDPVSPVENHVVDSGELHEWDITEATDGTSEQAPITNDPIVVDPSQITDLDITEDAGDLFEEWPAIDNAVDTSQTPALESDAAGTPGLPQEDTSLPEIHIDQAADGQTTGDVNPDIGTDDWNLDETPGEVESGSNQQLDGEHTLADGGEPAAEDVLTEGASHPEETTSMEGLESTEHIPGAWVSDAAVDSNDVLVDAHVPPASDLVEEPPLDISKETQPGEHNDSTELQASDEPGNSSPLPTQPAEDADKLLPEADPNVEIAPAALEHEADADTALEVLEGVASLQAESSQPPEESPKSSTELPPTQSTTDTEEIPLGSAPVPEIQNPSILVDPAPHSEGQPAETMAETNEMVESEDLADTQVDELAALPPSQESTLEKEQIQPDPAIALDPHDPSTNIDPVLHSEERPVEIMAETNKVVEMNEVVETNETVEMNGAAGAPETAETNEMAETKEMAEVKEVAEENGMAEANEVAGMNEADETGEMAETNEGRIDIQIDASSAAPPVSDIHPNETSVEGVTNGVTIVDQESSFSALTAQDVATPEIVAISEMFGTMRAALLAMTSAFDKLTVQTERMAADSLHIKAAEQLEGLKAALGHQIARQKSDVEALRLKLQAKIKQAAEEKIRTRLRDVIKQAVKMQVEEKVRAQMAVQIPDELRQQVISHQRKIIQVKTDLHNSEARMFNALQTVPGARLRPLLRPLPTPEQSPVIINISRSTSMGSTTLGTPASSFPSGPAPTPIRRSVSNSMRPGGGLETIPPTPSKFFPRDLNALFALSQDEARRLLREYGLKSTTVSPAVENNTPMRARGLSIVNEEGPVEEDPEVHARDMNTFMAHIGVPFLMIPPPKEKPGEERPPLSSRSRRKMLTPLIIK